MEILENTIKSSVGWIRIKVQIKKNLREQQKELEKNCNPIIKIYQSTRGLQKKCLGASLVGDLIPQVVIFQGPSRAQEV